MRATTRIERPPCQSPCGGAVSGPIMGGSRMAEMADERGGGRREAAKPPGGKPKQPSSGGKRDTEGRFRSAQSSIFLLILGLACLAGGPSRAAVIDFAGPQPVVLVNEPVTLRVQISYAQGEVNSLFSFGVAAITEGLPTWIVPLGVDVPGPLDFNGVAGPGAQKIVFPEFIGAKGTVDLSANPVLTYTGAVLAEVRYQFNEPGTYPIRLDFFNTLGPTEDIFVNGNGVAIDDSIEFGSTIVHVIIPEPRLAMLLLAAALCLLARRRVRSF